MSKLSTGPNQGIGDSWAANTCSAAPHGYPSGLEHQMNRKPGKILGGRALKKVKIKMIKIQERGLIKIRMKAAIRFTKCSTPEV